MTFVVIIATVYSDQNSVRFTCNRNKKLFKNSHGVNNDHKGLKYNILFTIKFVNNKVVIL